MLDKSVCLNEKNVFKYVPRAIKRNYIRYHENNICCKQIIVSYPVNIIWVRVLDARNYLPLKKFTCAVESYSPDLTGNEEER